MNEFILLSRLSRSGHLKSPALGAVVVADQPDPHRAARDGNRPAGQGTDICLAAAHLVAVSKLQDEKVSASEGCLRGEAESEI